jgi:hypothetical protein
MTTPDSAAPEAAATPDATRPGMQGSYPPCPCEQRFPVITGFITPGSDDPQCHSLDACINMDVYDPTEFVGPGKFERIRVVETDDPFLIEVNWCICGSFAASIAGCWDIKFYLNRIDGTGPSPGKLSLEEKRSVDSSPAVPGKDDDFTKRCYSVRGTVAANTVAAGAYSLLAVITLLSGTCDKPGKALGDYLGFAEIPVLIFVPGE